MKSLPPLFIEQIERYNDSVTDGLTEALASTAPSVSIRLNRRKPVDAPAAARPVPWCAEGFYLDRRPQFTFDPAMHQGRYYVQDASSMIISEVVRQLSHDFDRPLIYIDACAAPGGKTTAAIDALPDGSLVIANEFDFRRAEILKENIMKWGYAPVVVSRGDTSRLGRLRGLADIVAADVPCSGEGMFRKDDEAIACWSPQLVATCVARQREIVANLWDAVAPGGYFIYSTCTFNRCENEEMVDHIINEYGAESVGMDFERFPQIAGGIGTPHHCYRFMPHRVEGEGLFVAVLRRPGDRRCPRPEKSARQRDNKKTAISLPPMVDGCDYIAESGTVYAIPRQWAATIQSLEGKLDIIAKGIEAGTIKGRDIIPSQALAMAVDLLPGSFPTVSVDLDTALTYLRREAVTLPCDASRGIVLLTYDNHPLGFVKNLGNRANNLYPAPWRILRRP